MPQRLLMYDHLSILGAFLAVNHCPASLDFDALDTVELSEWTEHMSPGIQKSAIQVSPMMLARRLWFCASYMTGYSIEGSGMALADATTGTNLLSLFVSVGGVLHAR